MWAVAAQPRCALTPMIPTPSVDSGLAVAANRGPSDRSRSGWSSLLIDFPSWPCASGDRLHALASSNFAGQYLEGVGKAGSDLLVGELAFVEAGVGMRDGELDIEYPRAERGQDFAELGLRPDRPERAGARADHEHRLVPEHVVRDRARDPVDRILQLARNGGVVLRRREEHRVPICDRRVQARDTPRARVHIVVLVVRRNL